MAGAFEDYLAGKAQSQAPLTAYEQYLAEENKRPDFTRRLKNAFQEFPQFAYGLAAITAAGIETAAGEGGLATSAKNWAIGKYKVWGDAIAAESKPSDDFLYSWERAQQGEYGALVDWLQGSVAYAVGQGLQLLGGAYVGKKAGELALKPAVEKLAASVVGKEAKRIALEEATRTGATLTAEQLAARTASDEVRKAAVRNVAGKAGAIGTVGAQAFGMEGGEIGGDLAARSVDENRVLTGAELRRAGGATLLAGLYEFAGDALGLGVLLGKVRVGKTIGEMTGVKGRVARTGASASLAAPVEGFTEYMQTGAEEYGKGKEESLLPWGQSQESQRHAISAAAQGVVGGTVMGGVGGAARGPAFVPESVPATPEGVAVAPIMAAGSVDEAMRAAGAAYESEIGKSVLQGLVDDRAIEEAARQAEEYARANAIAVPATGLQEPSTGLSEAGRPGTSEATAFQREAARAEIVHRTALTPVQPAAKQPGLAELRPSFEDAPKVVEGAQFVFKLANGASAPVISVADAAKKWEQVRDASVRAGEGGVSVIGNGGSVYDANGTLVANISYNGRIWEPESGDGSTYKGKLLERTGEQWTDEEDAKLRAGVKTGKTVAVLANEHKRTEEGIRARIERLGLKTSARNEGALPSPAGTQQALWRELAAKTDGTYERTLIAVQQHLKAAMGFQRKATQAELQQAYAERVKALRAVIRWAKANQQEATNAISKSGAVEGGVLGEPRSADAGAGKKVGEEKPVVQQPAEESTEKGARPRSDVEKPTGEPEQLEREARRRAETYAEEDAGSGFRRNLLREARRRGWVFDRRIEQAIVKIDSKKDRDDVATAEALQYGKQGDPIEALKKLSILAEHRDRGYARRAQDILAAMGMAAPTASVPSADLTTRQKRDHLKMAEAKAKAAANAAREAAPKPSAAPSDKPPELRIRGQLPSEMRVEQLQRVIAEKIFPDWQREAEKELKRRDRKGQTVMGKTIDQLTDKMLEVVERKGKNAALRKAAGDERERRAQVTAGLKERLAKPSMAETLKGFANDAGWSQRGGHLIRGADETLRKNNATASAADRIRERMGAAEGQGQVIGRTKWIPRAEWWRGRPVDEGESYYKEAVRAALAGDKLTAKQREVVNFLLAMAEDSEAGIEVPPDTTQAQVEEAQAVVDEMGDAPADWSKMSDEEKDRELDAIFGPSKGQKSAAQGEGARAPVAQEEVGPAGREPGQDDEEVARPSDAIARQLEAKRAELAHLEAIGDVAKIERGLEAAREMERRVADRPARIAALQERLDRGATEDRPALELSQQSEKDLKAKEQQAATGKIEEQSAAVRDRDTAVLTPPEGTAPPRSADEQKVPTQQQGLFAAADALIQAGQALKAATNPEQRSRIPVAESQAPATSEPGDAAVARGRGMAAPEGHITDVGENLWANRRNFTSGATTWDDVKGLNDALKVREVVKTKVWPKPNYELLVEQGMQPFFARMLKQVYDGIATAPAGKSDAEFQRYIDVVGRVRDAVFDWAKDNNENRTFMEEIARQTKLRLERRFAIGDLADKVNIRDVILDRVWPTGADQRGANQRFSRGSEALEEIRSIGGNRALKHLQFDMDSAVEAMKDLEKGWPKSQEQWQRQGIKVVPSTQAQVAEGTIYRDGKGTPTWSLRTSDSWGSGTVSEHTTKAEAEAAKAALKPFMLLSKREKFLGQFDTEEQAKEAAREATKREAKGGDIRGMNISQAERTGEARREEGENVTPERLMQEFGFRGINFGRENWINQAERQAYLNHAYDGLLDLAELLDVPPKALSLDGMLGIAFGAQGRGGRAAAHFIPGVNEINLTKTMGAGTLAHEWGHALDHYFATASGLAKDSEPFMSQHSTRDETMTVRKPYAGFEQMKRFGEVRPEVIAAFKAVTEVMEKRPMTEAEVAAQRQMAQKRTVERLDSWLQHFRKDIERTKTSDEALTLFDQAAERLRKGDKGNGYVKVRGQPLSEVVGAIKLIVRDHTKNSSVDLASNYKGLDANASSVAYQAVQKQATKEHIPQTTRTTYAGESNAKDQEKKGKPYWRTRWEMFARAFETWVGSKLEERARSNTFLSDALNRAESIDQTTGRHAQPYPRGEDRQRINAAMDKLVQAIETKETDKGVAMFSRRSGDGADAEAQFAAAERSYGGREAYNKARSTGRTALNYRQWVQVRTPFFKRWFGDWELASLEKSMRRVRGPDQARAVRDEIVGVPIINLETGITATVSNAAFGKMMSESAVRQSVSSQAHMQALGNLDALFQLATRTETRAGKKPGDAGRLDAVHQFAVPMPIGEVLRVNILAKEFTDQKQGTRLYQVEAVEIATPASEKGESVPSGEGRSPHLPAGVSERFAQMLAAVKGEGVSKVLHHDIGEPMVVHHGTRGERTVFEPYWRQIEQQARPHELAGDGAIARLYRMAKEEPEMHFFATEEETARTYGANVVAAFLNIRNPAHGESNIEAVDAMLASGNDGARIGNEQTSRARHGGEAWVVRTGTQIKSATGNRGAFDPENPDIRFARGERRAGITREDFRAELEKAFGAKATDRLLERAIMLLDTRAELPGSAIPFLREGDIVYGFFDPKTDRTHAVLENLSHEQVRGLVMHEVGVHYGFKRMLGEEKYARVMRRLELMRKAGNKNVQVAYETAKAEAAHEDQVDEETLAYLVQRHPGMSLVQEVISAIKTFLYREFGIGASMLDENDLAMLAKAAVLRAGIETMAAPELAAAFHRAFAGKFARGERPALAEKALAPEAPTRRDAQAAADLADLERIIERWTPVPRGIFRPVRLPEEQAVQAVARAFGTRALGIEVDESKAPAGPRASQFLTGWQGLADPGTNEVIYLRADARRPMLGLVGHELAHYFAKNDRKAFRQLIEAIRPYVKQKEYGARFAAAYPDMDTEDIREEFVGEVFSDGFMDEGFWDVLGRHSPELLRKVIHAVRQLFDAALRALGRTGYTSKTREYLTDFDAVMAIAAKAAAKYGERQGAVAEWRTGLKFAQTASDIRFSPMEPPIGGGPVMGDSQDAFSARASSWVNDMLHSDARVGWWGRTVGTQQHKAMTNREFAPVFDETQAFLADISRFANEAADAAPDLLPRIEQFGDFWKKTPKQTDVEMVTQAVYAGTLYGGGNPLEGRKWTEQELRDGRARDGGISLATFKPLNEEQIRLYKQVMESASVSLDNYGKSQIAKLLRPHGIGFDRDMAFEDVIQTVQLAIEEQITDANAELEIVSDPDFVTDQASDAYETAGGDRRGEMAAADERRRLEKLARKLTQELETLKSLNGKVRDVSAKITRLKERGYFPAMRFGPHAIQILERGENGEERQVFYQLFESQTAANLAARELRQEFPEGRLVRRMIPQEQHRLFQGLAPDLLEAFADYLTDEEGAPIGRDPLVQAFIQATATQRSYLNRHIHRKGVPGFSRDLPRVLAAFTTSAARAASSNYHGAEMFRLAKQIKVGDLQDEAITLVRYLQDPEEEAYTLRAFLFIQFIGGSIAHGIVNMTQPAMVSMPYLSQYTSAADAATQLGRAMVAKEADLTGNLATAFQRAKKEGVVAPQEIHQLRAEAGGAPLGRSLLARKLSFLWGSIYSVTEQFNRKTTFLAAYRIAEKKGMQNPYAFARDAVNQTQFIYNKGARPNWARGPIGATIFTFKTFSISYLELAKRLYDLKGPDGKPNRKPFALMVLMLLVAAGLEGLPFAEDIEDLIDTLGQWMGYSTNSKKKLRQWAIGVLGPDFAQVALHGISGIPAFPVDVSVRMGLQNLLPGTAMLKPSEKSKVRDLIEFLGPAGQLVPVEGTAMGKAIERASKGDPGGVLKAAAPVAARNVVLGAEMLDKGYATDLKGKKITDVSAAEAAFKMVGLNPAAVARESEKMRVVQADVNLQRRMEEEIAEKWARGIVDKDKDAVRGAMMQLNAWNRDNPELRIRVTMEQIRRRVQEMGRSRLERTVRGAPPEIRGMVRDELRRSPE